MLHRHARPGVAGAFAAGSVLGACFTAALLAVGAGLLSPIPADARATVALLVLTLLWLHASGILCLDLPQNRRQIPQVAFHDRPARAALRFAAELGTGLRTYLPNPSAHGLAIVLLLAPGSGLAAVTAAASAAVGFGCGRAVIVVAHTQRERVAVEHPQRWLRAAGFVSLATATTLTALAVL